MTLKACSMKLNLVLLKFAGKAYIVNIMICILLCYGNPGLKLNPFEVTLGFKANLTSVYTDHVTFVYNNSDLVHSTAFLAGKILHWSCGKVYILSNLQVNKF